MKARLDHVVIHVSDWERSNALYRDVLGAEPIERGDGPMEAAGEHLADGSLLELISYHR